MENDILWDSYFYPNSDVLINNLNIRDYDKLKEAEATISYKKLLYLSDHLIDGDFDIEHLKKIHKFIFEDIYPFAGVYRKVNLQKKIGSFLFIKSEDDLDNYINEIFNDVRDDLNNCFSRFDFCCILANLYTKLIYAHPFREGNGRSIREFIREFSIVKSHEINIGNYELDWSLIDKDELDSYLEIAHIYPSSTAIIFDKALVLKDNKNIRK